MFYVCRPEFVIFQSFASFLASRLPARKPTEESPERRLLSYLPQDSNLQPSDYQSIARPLKLEMTSLTRLILGFKLINFFALHVLSSRRSGGFSPDFRTGSDFG